MMLFAALLAAIVWHPAPGWTESPDPIADPRAAKGGTLRFSGGQPPKSLNAYIDSAAYTRMTFELMYECLIDLDPQTLEAVPCLARRWGVSEDGREFVFVIDGRARWSDGAPVTAADVKWTFDTVMDPASDTGSWKAVLGEFESPEVLDATTVRFVKKGNADKDWRDLVNCGMFGIMPKHAFEGRNFNSADLADAPVSGPYRLSRIVEQVETEFERVPGWWRAGFPSTRGTCNFDRIVMRYSADSENAFESLKKRAIDVYPVYLARIMSDQTHGEKFDRNWILKRSVRNHRPVGFQGFAMNMRRKPFDDVRVRRAMAMLVDRETMNRTMMSNAYFMLCSYYSDLYGAGCPCPNAPVRFDVDGARRLLAEAGLAGGFEFSFLSRSGSEDKFLSLFGQALAQCNVRMRIVRKDFAAWMRDMDSFNYDMTWAAWGASVIRSPETMWLSGEADRRGSGNIAGLKNAEIDGICRAEKAMEDVGERNRAYRRIDALLVEESPYALLWNTDRTRLVYWNKFGMPRTVLPRFTGEEGVLRYWWYDLDRAEELDDAMRRHACLPNVPFEVDFDEASGRNAAANGN